MKITEIPEKQLPVGLRKKRTAIYARVSSNKEEQENSFEAQKSYFEKFIQDRENLVYAGTYADYGISGTEHTKRVEFNRMVADCESGKIDLIVTKSLSRFARNTVDSLVIIRKLKALDVEVYFQKENIWTLDSKGEFVLTLLSMFAEEESHSISENTKWGIRKLFEDGKYSVAYSKFWGYDKGFVINEEQAAVIRKIFTLFLLGYSSEKIGKLLDGEGIKTICNAPQWSGATVISILHNEKYKGDALSQKFYVEDFRTKKKVKNETLPKYYVENGHEPIIDRDVFDVVQEKLSERPASGHYSGNNLWAPRLRCGICGKPFGRRVSLRKGYSDEMWVCRGRSGNVNKGARCACPYLYDNELTIILMRTARHLIRKNSAVERCFRALCLDTEKIQEVSDWKLSSICEDDIAMLVQRITVYPEKRIEVQFIDGSVFRTRLGHYSPQLHRKVSKKKAGKQKD